MVRKENRKEKEEKRKKKREKKNQFLIVAPFSTWLVSGELKCPLFLLLFLLLLLFLFFLHMCLLHVLLWHKRGIPMGIHLSLYYTCIVVQLLSFF